MEKIKFAPQTLLYPMPAVLVGAKVEMDRSIIVKKLDFIS